GLGRGHARRLRLRDRELRRQLGSDLGLHVYGANAVSTRQRGLRMRRFSVCLLFLSALTASAAQAAPPTPPAATCGNGLLEAGETCGKCPADCAVNACETGSDKATFDVTLSTPESDPASTAVMRIAYRNQIVALPGHGTDPALRSR